MELSTITEAEAEQSSLNRASVGTVNDYGVSQMSLVRNVTDEVIGSLSAISEQLQVSKVAGSDIWRKLRATESGLSRLKTESESVQLSHERIESWESKHGLKESAIPGLSSPSATIRATSSHSAFGKQAQKHYASTCDLLEKASAQAQRLLVTP